MHKNKKQAQLSFLTDSSSRTNKQPKIARRLDLQFWARKLLIQTIGHDLNTLKPLYTNILLGSKHSRPLNLTSPYLDHPSCTWLMHGQKTTWFLVLKEFTWCGWTWMEWIFNKTFLLFVFEWEHFASKSLPQRSQSLLWTVCTLPIYLPTMQFGQGIKLVCFPKNNKT